MGASCGKNYDPNQIQVVHDPKKVLQNGDGSLSNDSTKLNDEKKLADSVPIKNNKVSYWLEMDKFDEQNVKEYLGENCFQNDSNVDIYLLGREFSNPFMFSSKHWAWLFKFKNHPSHRYATVEYADKGIMMGIYEDELKLSHFDICSTIVGDSNKIVYTKEFKTERKWGEILEQVTKMRNKYPAKDYSIFTNSCRAFARDLGRFLTPDFTKSQYNFGFDKKFPDVIDSNKSFDWTNEKDMKN